MNKSKKRIAAIFADMGTFNCFYTPITMLQKQNIEVTMFVDPDGTAKKAFAKAGVSVQETTDVDVSDFDLVLCGTNGKAMTLQRNVTIAVKKEQKKRSIEIVWCGDFYLSGCEKKVRDLKPDWLTQIDDSARELAVEIRRDIPADRIVTLGNSSFDGLARAYSMREEIRTRVRKTLGLNPSKKLLLFSASAMDQFDRKEMYETLDAIFNYCKKNKSIVLVVSFHPADPYKAQLEDSVREMSNESVMVSDRITDNPLENLAAADAVIVQYSTEGAKACLVTPTAFVLLPSMRAYQKTRGGSWHNKFFPPIQHGAAEGIWDKREIAPTIDRMLYGEPDYYEALEEARKKHFKFLLDGCSTKRFINFIEQLLTTRKV